MHVPTTHAERKIKASLTAGKHKGAAKAEQSTLLDVQIYNWIIRCMHAACWIPIM